MACGILVPQPGIKPVSPSLRGRFLTTGLPGKSSSVSETAGVIVVIQSPSHVQLFATPWTAAHQASLSISVSWSLLKPMSIDSKMSSNHLLLCCTLLLLTFPVLGSFPMCWPIKWPKYWNFSFSISPSNEYSELVSFRIDWFDLLAVQGIFKSLLQHHSLKASILWHSAFIMVKLSHPYVASGKAMVLTI